MSLENDPFDDVPSGPLGETQPAPLPLPPSYPPQYSAPVDVATPPPTLPRWAIIVMVIGGVLLLGAICVLFTLLVTQNVARPTPVPTTIIPQPTVQAIPSTVSGGTLVTVRGFNFKPDERGVFYLRDTSRPTEPILQIGTTTATPQGTFDWSFIYPADERWTTITTASVIVQSMATGAYLTTDLTVVPAGTLVPTRMPPTSGPIVVTIPPLTWTPTPSAAQPTLTQTPNPNEWRGQYFNNPNLQAPPIMVRNDASLNFNWGSGSPAPNIPPDYFSISWSRAINFEGGMYRFTASVDDGVRVWLDSNLIIDEWHTASPNPYVKEYNVPAGMHTVRVDYYEGVGLASINFAIDRVVSYPDWKGEYFNNSFLSGVPVFTRNDVAVSFDWGNNAPAAGVPAGNFSVRWSRTTPLDGGNYRFSFRVNSGVRFFVDGNLLINAWPAVSNQVYSADINLSPGTHTLVIEYYNQGGGAFIWFTYQPLTGDANQWNGNYFANNTWYGVPTMVRYDAEINFNWGQGAPSPLLPVDNFAIKWSRVLNLTAGEYQFDFTVDDGVRFYLDNQLLLDKVLQTATTNYQVKATLGQTGNHELRIEYVEYTGQALITFRITPLNVFGTATPTITPLPSATSTAQPTWTLTPTRTPTPSPASPPLILAFTSNAASINLGQCVTLAWNTANATSPIVLLLGGQTLQSGLPPSGTLQHCPTSVGQQVYTLTITSSPTYGPVSAYVNVDVVGPTPF